MTLASTVFKKSIFQKKSVQMHLEAHLTFTLVGQGHLGIII